MDYFKVIGPTKLRGTFTPRGNKNAALPQIAACLLTAEPVLLKNLPEIEDVHIMLKIAADLGASVEHLGPNTWQITAKDLNKYVVDPTLAGLVRTSILFAGPLLARLGHIILPKPGGDLIGRRRLDTHFLVFNQLGAVCHPENLYDISTLRLRGTYIHLDEASVTATENAVMTAVLAKGKTTIYNAACEPHVQDLCRMLVAMGAKIKGIGTNLIDITGVSELHGTSWEVISDHIEVGSLIGLAAVTGSELRINNIVPRDYHNIKTYFAKMGVTFDLHTDHLIVPAGQKMCVCNELDGTVPTIADSIWPGFPSDLTSIAVIMATQVKGTILIHEKMFESRLYFTDRLASMGAQIILCDPHRCVVSGPTALNPGTIVSPDIRAGMAMLIAALIAQGESTIQNIRQIDRGYEAIDLRLKELGANIERISG